MSRMMSDCEGFHRRDFLRAGVAGLLGMGLPDGPAGGGPRSPRPPWKKPATGVIQIWLSGGPATIDMWDLKPDAPEEIRGEFRPIATAGAGSLDRRAHAGAGEGDGPLRAGPLAGPHDHARTVRARPTWPRAIGRGRRWNTRRLGSLAARMLPSRRGVPPYVRFASMSEGLRRWAGLSRAGVRRVRGRGRARPRGPRAHVAYRCRRGCRSATWRTATPCERGSTVACAALDSTEVMAGLDGFHREAIEILRSDRVRSALDLSREPERLRDDYGRTTLGQGALAARRLIEAGARFVTLGFGGWDTHGATSAPSAIACCPPGPGALGPDRRPRVAGPAGRDHHRLRRRVRPHAADQRLRRARPLVALDGRAAGRRGLPRRVGPWLDRVRRAWRRAATLARPTTSPPRSSSGWASDHATRSLRQRAADRHLPRGAMPGRSGGLSDYPWGSRGPPLC